MSFTACGFFGTKVEEKTPLLSEKKCLANYTPEQINNRAKVIATSGLISVGAALMMHKYLFASLNEPVATIAAVSAGIAIFLILTPCGWKLAPCMIAERCAENKSDSVASNRLNA